MARRERDGLPPPSTPELLPLEVPESMPELLPLPLPELLAEVPPELLPEPLSVELPEPLPELLPLELPELPSTAPASTPAARSSVPPQLDATATVVASTAKADRVILDDHTPVAPRCESHPQRQGFVSRRL